MTTPSMHGERCSPNRVQRIPPACSADYQVAIARFDVGGDCEQGRPVEVDAWSVQVVVEEEVLRAELHPSRRYFGHFFTRGVVGEQFRGLDALRCAHDGHATVAQELDAPSHSFGTALYPTAFLERGQQMSAGGGMCESHGFGDLSLARTVPMNSDEHSQKLQNRPLRRGWFARIPRSLTYN